ncbi:MAG: hypothetical protein ACYDCO_24005 [Armatimonadota bacterium]
MLKSRIRKLETLTGRRAPRRTLFYYENDWRGDRPNPTPEEMADPDVQVIRVRFVENWRGR